MAQFQRGRRADGTDVYTYDGGKTLIDIPEGSESIHPGAVSRGGETLLLTPGGWKSESQLSGEFGLGVGSGIARSLGNIIGDPSAYEQGDIPNLQDDAAQWLGGLREGGLVDPRGADVGQIVGETGAAVLGARGGGAAGNFLTKGNKYGELAGDIIGAGVGGVMAEDDSQQSIVGRIGTDIGIDTVMTGLSALVGSRAKRMWDTVNGIREKTRTVQSGADPLGAEAAERLQKQGFELTPGQASGDKAQRGLEDANANLTSQRKPFDQIAVGNQNIINAKTRKVLGMPENTPLSGENIKEAGDNIGVRVGSFVDQLGDDLIVPDSVAKQFEAVSETSFLDRNARNLAGDIFKDMENLKDGKMTGADWKQARTRIQNSLSSTNDQNTQEALFKLNEAIEEIPTMSLASSGMDPGQVAEWKQGYAEARDQYRNYKSIADTGSVSEAGDVMPIKMGQNMNKKTAYGEQFRLNQPTNNPDVTEFQSFLKDLRQGRMRPVTGNPGTANMLEPGIQIARNMETARDASMMLDNLNPLVGLPAAVRAMAELTPAYRLAPESSDTARRFGAATGLGLMNLADYITEPTEEE